jgi:hypothetical protein
MPTGPPTPPVWQSTGRHVRPDGTVKGPSRRRSLSVLGAGLVLGVISAVGVVPVIQDSLDGPRFATPSSQELTLDTGTWVVFERTGSTHGGAGFTFSEGTSVSLSPRDVTVTGPSEPVVRSDLGGNSSETVTRGSAVYTGALRFDVTTKGRYTVTVSHEGEVLVARPLSHVFSRWPFLVAGVVGGAAVIAGVVMWIVGAGHRREVRKAS